MPRLLCRRIALAWPDIEGLDHRDTVTDFGLPEGMFFDCAVVHLLTTATLDRLRALYPDGRFEVRPVGRHHRRDIWRAETYRPPHVSAVL
jgi:hypothetical protein